MGGFHLWVRVRVRVRLCERIPQHVQPQSQPMQPQTQPMSMSQSRPGSRMRERGAAQNSHVSEATGILSASLAKAMHTVQGILHPQEHQ